MEAAELKRLLKEIRDPDQARAAQVSARLVDVIAKPVLGMIRARVSQDSAEEISQDVIVKILVHKPRWDPRGQVVAFRSYLRKVVDSAVAEHFRRRARPQPDLQKEDLEWLFETARGGCPAPNQVLVAAFHVLLGFSLPTIAAERADTPMRALAALLSKRYRGPARFDELVRKLDGPSGDRCLSDFVPGGASTRNEFERWLRLVQRCAENRWPPQSKMIAGSDHPLPVLPHHVVRQTLRELLRLTKAPHKLIVFVFYKLLELEPSEIRARAGRPLKELCAEAKQGCKDLGLRTIAAAQWDDYFAALEQTMAGVGDTTLSDYSKEAEVEVDDWVRHVYLQFMTKVHDQEHDFLTCVFAQRQAHQAIAYALGDLLKMPADEIWRRSNDPLRCLSALLKTGYQERYDLAPARIDDCFQELETKLRQFTLRAISDETRRNACLARNARRIGDTCFNDYYISSGRAQKLDEIRRWQREIRARVRADIDRHKRGLLFAWVYGWLFGST